MEELSQSQLDGDISKTKTLGEETEKSQSAKQKSKEEKAAKRHSKQHRKSSASPNSPKRKSLKSKSAKESTSRKSGSRSRPDSRSSKKKVRSKSASDLRTKGRSSRSKSKSKVKKDKRKRKSKTDVHEIDDMEWGAPVTMESPNPGMGTRLFQRVQERLEREGRQPSLDSQKNDSMSEKEAKLKIFEEELAPQVVAAANSATADNTQFTDLESTSTTANAPKPFDRQKLMKRRGSTGALIRKFESGSDEDELVVENTQVPDGKADSLPLRPSLGSKQSSTRALTDEWERKAKRREQFQSSPMSRRRGSTGGLLSSLVKTFEHDARGSVSSPRQSRNLMLASRSGSTRNLVKNWESMVRLPNLEGGERSPIRTRRVSAGAQRWPLTPQYDSTATKRHRRRALERQKEWKESLNSLLVDS